MRGMDLTGQRFGRLIVLCYSHTHRYFRKDGTVACGTKIWKVRCDCGNIKYCQTGGLTSGRTQSCGCLHKELVSERARIKAAEKRLDLSGSSMGMLTYIKDVEPVNENRKILVLCACGTQFECFAHAYISGHSKSCGCLQKRIAGITITKNRKG